MTASVVSGNWFASSVKLINRINAATYSIDVALYSLSGTVGANVAAALIAAKGRGVKVRVIGEKDNQGTAPWTTLKKKEHLNSAAKIFGNMIWNVGAHISVHQD